SYFPALVAGLYAGRLLSELLRPGLAGAAALTLISVALGAFAVRRQAPRRATTLTLALLPLLAYIFYPWPDWHVALAALATAALTLLLIAAARCRSLLQGRAIFASAGVLFFLFLTLYVVTVARGVL